LRGVGKGGFRKDEEREREKSSKVERGPEKIPDSET